jgi:hypothetical protein
LDHDGTIDSADLTLWAGQQGQSLGPPLPPAAQRSLTAGSALAVATVAPAPLAAAEAQPQATAQVTMSALADGVLTACPADAFLLGKRPGLGTVILGGARPH